MEGRGRHELKLTVRMAVQRQGGSRTVSAVIPAADATSVTITVPDAGTTVRRKVHTVTLSETTQQAGQTLAAALQSGGVLELNWRPKTSPGAVDQALTANSMALVDVREDGMRVIWQVKLVFGQTERGTFRLEVPDGYLVERVDGSNVRGWETANEQGHTFMTVELLKAVKQQEEMTIHLSRAQPRQTNSSARWRSRRSSYRTRRYIAGSSRSGAARSWSCRHVRPAA